MSKGRIIFVDDDQAMRATIKQYLGLAGFDVRCLADAQSAIGAIKGEMADILVTDLRMPGVDGMELLTMSKRAGPDVPVILMTAHGDISTAVKAMRNGAYDFLEKPFEPDHLVEVLHRAMEKVRLVAEVRKLRSRIGAASALEDRLIGTSGPARRLRTAVAEIAGINIDVLIEGDTGTGKEIVARALHDFGPRARGPFVPINCAAVPPEIAEGLLFGTVKGIATDATDRAGTFESANGGTLFLDEIESMPLALQAKVLRVIQERTVERVGGNRSIPIDIRIVTATKSDLTEESRAGRFRIDLFYRLNGGVKICLPRLRDRKDDIPLLFETFTIEAAKRHGLAWRAASSDDVARLMAHDWPGNVRELKSVAERFALGLTATGRSVSEILDGADRVLDEDGSLSARVAAYESALIAAALAEHRGNIAAVLNALKIPRRTLYDKMDRFKLDRTQFVGSSGE
jgi:two-component system C4-dicarboxylate transport response regulator DctD